MLYLREAARCPISTEPLSYSLSRRTTNLTFTPHDSDTTYSYGESVASDSARQISRAEPGAETRSITCTTAFQSFHIASIA